MRYLLSVLLTMSFFVLYVDGQTRRARSKPPAKRKEISVVKEAPKPPAESLSFGLTVEKYVSNYELNSDGTGRETLEMQQRCHSDMCLANLANIKRVYNGKLEKVKLLDAQLLKADGSKLVLPASAYSDNPTAQAEAAPGFSSLRELEIRFENLAKGDAVYFKLETVTVRANFERRFDALEIFPVLFDWKSIEINVSAPSSYPLFVEGHGLDGGKIDDLDGRSRWQFKKKDLAKIEIEPMMHDIMGISPRFALTNFRSFDELGASYWESMKDKTVVTPEIQTLAAEITKGVSDPSQQASRIYEWVNKNVRYLSIVLDRSGWVPHSASEIITNRYGDCKDYTTVIHTLLKAKGIESTPVLIRSDLSAWFPGVATANYFNHAILYIPSINLFADATTPNTRLGLVPQVIVGKKAVLAGEKTGMIRVPDNDPAGNQIISDVNIEFQPNGNLKARTRNTYVGRSEIVFRPLFGDSTFMQNSTTFVKTLLAYFGVNGHGNILNVGNPHKVGEPFSVDIEANVDDFTTFLSKGRLELPIGISMVNMRALEGFATTETRRTNLIVGATTFRETFSVTLPPQVTPTSTPRVASFSNTIGSFKLSSEVKDRKVGFTRELVLNKDVVQPGDYPAFKELIQKMLAVHDVDIEYTADPSLLRDKSKQLRAGSAKVPAQTPRSYEDELYERLVGHLSVKKLTPVEIRRMEAKLAANEKDVETRLTLLRHYTAFETRKTAATKSSAFRHRLWLVRNRPDISDYSIFGLSAAKYEPDTNEFRQLKDEWLARVEADKKNSQLRFNAIAFVRGSDAETAEKIVRGGIELDPDNYKFPLAMTEILGTELYARSTAEARRLEVARRLVDYGNSALALIKKERGDDRDSDRGELLRRLCNAAFEMGKLDEAASYAKELVLDFSQSSADHVYDEAAHVGNTILGLVELRRNNVEKAKEHLMTSIRAPLRKEYNSLSQIDTRLARELYAKGEKGIVLEYLKLCLNLGNLKEYPESHAEEIKALKLWQDQIGKGINPSFDFEAP